MSATKKPRGSSAKKRPARLDEDDLDLDLDLSSDVKGIMSAKKPRGSSAMKRPARLDEDDLDLDLSSDIKGIMSALHQIKEKAQKDGQKKNEETISSVALEIKSMMDEVKAKIEKERQTFAKALSKSSKECENCLKMEASKFQETYERFCKDREAHLQAMKDSLSRFEENKEKMFLRYEQLRKKEKSMITEQEKACAEKISNLEESLKKKRKDDKTFSFLRKTLGTFLGNASDEDFLPDE